MSSYERVVYAASVGNSMLLCACLSSSHSQISQQNLIARPTCRLTADWLPNNRENGVVLCWLRWNRWRCRHVGCCMSTIRSQSHVMF